MRASLAPMLILEETEHLDCPIAEFRLANGSDPTGLLSWRWFDRVRWRRERRGVFSKA